MTNWGVQTNPVRNVTVILPKAYSTAHYIVLITPKSTGWNGYPYMASDYALTSFTFRNANMYDAPYVWLSMGL